MKVRSVAVSGLLLGGVILATAGASAESLADKKKWADQNAYISGNIRDANRDCGITDPKKAIALTWDKASFASQDPSAHSWSSECANVFNAIEGVCSGPVPETKAAVQGQIKRVVCRYGGKGKFGLSLANGTLTYNIDWDESGPARKVEEFVSDHLMIGSESLSDRRFWDYQKDYISGAVADVNKKCGIDPKKPVTLEWDKASYPKSTWADHAPHYSCADVANDLAFLCTGPVDAKPSVRAKVNKIVCRYGGKGKFGLSLANGTLTYNVDWDQSGAAEKINEFLKAKL